MSTLNLYEYPAFFKLIINGVQHYIDEPVNWDKIDIENVRDATFFGFNYSFVSDKQTLAFPQDDGSFDLIRNVYETDGADNAITFQFGIKHKYNAVEIVLYEGTLNLYTYNPDKDFQINVSVEKRNFENLFRTRYETAIDLSAAKTLDGATMIPCQMQSVTLHSKKINKLLQSKNTIPEQAVDPGSMARFFFLQLDMSNEVTSELSGGQGIPLGITGHDPMDVGNAGFIAAEAGNYTINVAASFHIAILVEGGHVDAWELYPYFAIRRAGVIIHEDRFPQFKQNGYEGSHYYLDAYMNFSYSYNTDLQIGDEVYMEVTGTQGRPGTHYEYYIDNYLSDIKITGATVAVPTQAGFYRLYDAIDKLMESATGRQNTLISNVLGPGGRLHDYFISNGYQVRNFNVLNFPVNTTLKLVIEAACAEWCLGIGFATRNGADYLLIEDATDFYKDVEVAKIREVYDYSETHASNMTFNTYEVGYSKYPTIDKNVPNSMDEFNTYQTGLMPIKNYKGAFTKKIDWVASGYLLENQRREQFSANPSESLGDDDSIFILAVNSSGSSLVAEKNENFPTVTGIYSPETVYNLALSPKRVLYAWAPYLNVCLTKQPTTGIIKNTFIKLNNALQSTFRASDVRRKNEPLGLLVESADISLVDFKAVGRLHMDNYATFSAKMKFDDINTIISKLTGSAQSLQDFGYIVHPDNLNNLFASYVYSLKYNPVSEVAVFTVAKKRIY